MDEERRKFIKQTCFFCAGLATLGMSASLSSCTTIGRFKSTVAQDQSMRVPLSSFEAGAKLLIVQPKQYPYDIMLVKKSASDILALEMKCTHQDNILVANDKGLSCNLHGSTYDLEGRVTNPPALTPLSRFKTEVKNQEIIIYGIPVTRE